MANNPSLNTVYLVTGSNKNVTLEIIIGAPGQTSRTMISIDDDIIADDHPGSFFESPIGKNKSLDGKTLFITSNITDTSPDTNHTEMLIRLRGGVTFREYPLAKVVDEEGESVPYLSVIEFLKI